MNAKSKKNETRKSPHTAWDDGTLGRDEKYTVRSSPEREKEVLDALDLKMISIRLQGSLIKKLKIIAKYHGIGYQPLIRDNLNKFVHHEFKLIMRQLEEESRLEAEQQATSYLSESERKTA